MAPGSAEAAPQTMRAMVLRACGTPLELAHLPLPQPREGDIRIRIEACAICRTDLHVIDGDLPNPALPLVLGHEIVGRVDALGAGVSRWRLGDRVGVPWLAWTCGRCDYCRRGAENLCDGAEFTGYHRPGGFADYTVADARHALRLPAGHAADLAPLLCAGLIGYRALRMAGDASRIGFFGFGASAHILAQLVVAEGRTLFAFTRPGDLTRQALAREHGAWWAGGSDERAPAALDAAIIFAPVGDLVPQALRAVRKGGTVVCAGIHMSEIPAFPYALLWGERTLRSVANLTIRDGEEFLARAPGVPVRAVTERFALAEANRAVDALRRGEVDGAAVLVTGWDGAR